MAEPQKESALEPFKAAAFTVLWTATVVGNVGTWMRDTTSAWVMASQSPSPLMVSLIQAASTLPIFILALPAGALADIFDRRRLMLGIQVFLACISIALATSAYFGVLTPELLVMLTLMAGIGTALATPVWQSIVPQLVPKSALKAAISLNSMGVNVSRAIGPALAGLIIALYGTSTAYLVDVATYAIVLVALLWWRPLAIETRSREAFGGALAAGLRYAVHNSELHRVLVRAFLFFVPASAFWSLLPLTARVQLSGGPNTYGLLLAAAGVGAVSGALVMPKVRRFVGPDAMVVGGSLLVAAATAGMAFGKDLATVAAALFVAGAAWIAVLSTLNASAQLVLPNWVRGRGLAIYLTVFYGAMTAGSILWGQVGELTSLQTALFAAAVVAAALGSFGGLVRLPKADIDLAPSGHWPEPLLAEGASTEDGPVLVEIEYRVPPERHADFKEAIRPLAKVRRRDGAYAWGIQVDSHDQSVVVEWFLVASWAEHLRQHDRVSVEDRKLQDKVNAFHTGSERPKVRHLITLSGRNG